MSRGTDNNHRSNSPAAKHTVPNTCGYPNCGGDCIESYEPARPSPYRAHLCGWNILEDITTQTHRPNLTSSPTPKSHHCCSIAHWLCVLVCNGGGGGGGSMLWSFQNRHHQRATLACKRHKNGPRSAPLRARTADHRLLRTYGHECNVPPRGRHRHRPEPLSEVRNACWSAARGFFSIPCSPNNKNASEAAGVKINNQGQGRRPWRNNVVDVVIVCPAATHCRSACGC
ncbi:putative Sensor protein [Anopheles sinensis]|uniref:Putative Sensor protein n=1 Tax=Anopheles sinensis TaxID=74873 RepID=A0A084VQ37_ANOSI|nr:putative Sensor protein [Anopheles sinensis]